MPLLASSDRDKKEPDKIRRWKPLGTHPLEIWDLLIDGRILWDCQDDVTEFPNILARGLQLIRDGRAVTRSKGAVDPVATGFDAVFLTGGRSANAELQDRLSNLCEFPVFFSESPVFGAAEACLTSQWTDNPLVIDVGQTQIKIVWGDERKTFPRDWEKLPILSGDKDEKKLKKEFRRYLSESIRSMNAAPEAVILALPCHVQDDLTLGGSSYCGLKGDGDGELLRDVVSASGLADVTWHIVNDAELAGVLAKQESKLLAHYEKVLVLTLGFGTGACVLSLL